MEVKQNNEAGLTKLFSHGGIIYFVNDWVALKNDSERDWVAKIVGFDQCDSLEGDENMGNIRCQWAWYPDDLKAEVLADLDLEVYSDYEVVPSEDFIDTNPIGSIKHKLHVLPYKEFLMLEEYPHSDVNQFPPPIIFYRQTFNSISGLDPELDFDVVTKIKSGNLCYGARNPDLVYYRCIHCGIVYHPIAKGDSEIAIKKKEKPNSPDITFVCDKCQNFPQNNLSKELTESSTPLHKLEPSELSKASDFFSKRNSIKDTAQQQGTEIITNEAKTSLKKTKGILQSSTHTPQQKELDKKVRILKEYNSDDDHVSINSTSSGDINFLSKQNNLTKKVSILTQSPLQVGSLQKRRVTGSNRIQRSSSAASAAQVRVKSIDHTQHKRDINGDLIQNVRDLRKSKLLECLQRGALELEQKKQSHLMIKMSPMALAELIEEEFYKHYGNKDARQQKQRFFDIYSNLKRDNNADLRRKVWTSEMNASALVTANVQDLAPETLQREREAEQQKYFAEQVLLKGLAKPILRLTHKGLEEIQAPKDELDHSEVSSKSKGKNVAKLIKLKKNTDSTSSSSSSSLSSGDSKTDSSSYDSSADESSSSDTDKSSLNLTSLATTTTKKNVSGEAKISSCSTDAAKEKNIPQSQSSCCTSEAADLPFFEDKITSDEVKKEINSKEIKSSANANINKNMKTEEEDIKLKKRRRLFEMVPNCYKGILPAPPSIEKYGIKVLENRLKERLEKLNNIVISNGFLHFLNKGLIRVEKARQFVASNTQSLLR